ncbi:hypothetical protein [Halomarina ordinaria]|uniref:Major facilitator superfamily (MFS) profile domain-containing protein n=1 Tax=Halomarina ordinaria TaxID=3033939 RepID=A0ABD5U693_9EURY|nr:hypothetical protein [Halomarina sp. PSRA2]
MHEETTRSVGTLALALLFGGVVGFALLVTYSLAVAYGAGTLETVRVAWAVLLVLVGCAVVLVGIGGRSRRGGTWR